MLAACSSLVYKHGGISFEKRVPAHQFANIRGLKLEKMSQRIRMRPYVNFAESRWWLDDNIVYCDVWGGQDIAQAYYWIVSEISNLLVSKTNNLPNKPKSCCKCAEVKKKKKIEIELLSPVFLFILTQLLWSFFVRTNSAAPWKPLWKDGPKLCNLLCLDDSGLFVPLFECDCSEQQ